LVGLAENLQQDGQFDWPAAPVEASQYRQTQGCPILSRRVDDGLLVVYPLRLCGRAQRLAFLSEIGYY